MRILNLAAAVAILSAAAPASAQSAREILVKAAFTTRDRPTALASVGAALAAADAALARTPGDREARLQRAVAIGYRGKLKRNRSDVQAARKQFEAHVASNPRDPEAQMALGGWHLGSIIELGSLMARTGLGARKDRGLEALGASLGASGGRAVFPAYACLTRIMVDPRDVAGARQLAETAVRARVSRPEDRIMQRHAETLLPLLRAGNGKAAAALAHTLMPFGRLAK